MERHASSPVRAGADVAPFLTAVTRWAERRADVCGLAVVGSHARDAARPDSDLDLVILADSPAGLLQGSWPAEFGAIKAMSREDHGAVTSRRVFYQAGLEVEFAITAPGWAETPLDAGTRRVIAGGMKVLYDPKGVLGMAMKAALDRQ